MDENKQFEKSYDNFKGELSDQIQAQDNVVVQKGREAMVSEENDFLGLGFLEDDY